MQGWKTWAACGVIIITGIYLIVVEGEYTKGSELIGLGGVGIGIGHKIEKNIIGG